MSGFRTLWLILGVVFLDAFTKIVFFSSMVEQRHYVTTRWVVLSLLVLVVPIFGLWRYPAVRLALAFAIAGMVGNLLSVFGTGYVPDPFVIGDSSSFTPVTAASAHIVSDHHENAISVGQALLNADWLAFNLADLSLMFSVPILLVAFLSLAWTRTMRKGRLL